MPGIVTQWDGLRNLWLILNWLLISFGSGMSILHTWIRNKNKLNEEFIAWPSNIAPIKVV